MADQKYSSFTLNFNPGSRGNDKAPTLRGKSKVLASDGSATEFDVAAWGPKKASTGGPDFYDVSFTPADPGVAAARAGDPGLVRNAIEGFELTKVGYGKIFERGDAELAAGKNLPKFYGHALVQLAGEAVAIDLSAWKRDGFYSGNANLHDPKAAGAARAGKQSGDTPRPR
jgi:hypothetical protein